MLGLSVLFTYLFQLAEAFPAPADFFSGDWVAVSLDSYQPDSESGSFGVPHFGWGSLDYCPDNVHFSFPWNTCEVATSSHDSLGIHQNYFVRYFEHGANQTLRDHSCSPASWAVPLRARLRWSSSRSRQVWVLNRPRSHGRESPFVARTVRSF